MLKLSTVCAPLLHKFTAVLNPKMSNKARIINEQAYIAPDKYLLIFVATLGNKGDTKVTLNRTKKLSRKSPSSPSSLGADGEFTDSTAS